MSTKPVTARQVEILGIIGRLILAGGRAPSTRELARAFGELPRVRSSLPERTRAMSTYAVACHVSALKERGLLENAEAGTARGLRLTAEGWRLSGVAGCCPLCGGRGAFGPLPAPAASNSPSPDSLENL